MNLPRTIANAIDKVAQNAIGKDWGLYAALQNHWGEIVGSNYAEVTSPVKISFPKGKPEDGKWTSSHRSDGILHIRIPQGLVMEFTCKIETIKSRIASFFGYSAIEKVVFEPYYASKAAESVKVVDKKIDPEVIQNLKNQTEALENEELRDALQKLGETLAQSETNRNS